jgi:signal transduction histidine kinase
VLTPEEEQLAFALANQAVLALELTRLSEEASAAAVTEERNRFARELHDTLAQTFTGIFMQLQAAAEVAAARPDLTRACLARAEQLARDGLRYARQSVAALDRDADAYRDLVAAVGTVVQRATGGTATPAAMHVAGEPRLVEPAVGLHLLRICQEALGNAQRYAGASRLDVRLAFEPDAVTLSVGDDGVGFDPHRAGVGAGLSGMRQRAERLGGVLALRTGPGEGTVVEVRVPEHSVGLAALGGTA